MAFCFKNGPGWTGANEKQLADEDEDRWSGILAPQVFLS